MTHPRVGALGLALALLGGTGSFASSARAGAPRQAPERVLASICYHRFGVETAKDPYRISLQRLAGELAWLRSQGWAGVSLTQVAAALDGNAAALPSKGVLLSVDDGYRAGADAAPVFEHYGYRAVFFVVPSVLGRGAFMSTSDLRDLERRGHEVASHTMSHPDLAKVPRGMAPAAYARWVRHELVDSRRLLETALGHPVRAFAWPYGAYNPALVRAARRAGYRQLWTVSGGVNLCPGLDGMRLRRFILMGHPPLDTFALRLNDRPVKARPGSLHEGDLVYVSQLPLRLKLPSGTRAALGGVPLPADASGNLVLPSTLAVGFHYLDLADVSGRRSDSAFLFQVAPDAWKPYFSALDAAPPRP